MTPPRRVRLIVNPTSGRGRARREAPAFVTRLVEKGIRVETRASRSALDLRAEVRAAADQFAAGDAAAPDAVVVAGGDGSVHLAIQELAGSELPFGLLPVGTGDDNARLLGIPRRDPAAAADVVADGQVRVVDLGHVTTADGVGRHFLGVLSSGFDSEVNERANRISWPKGQARYLVSILGELRVFRPVPYTVTVDGTVHRGEAMLVAVGNGRSYGGGMLVCPDADPSDGVLELTWLTAVSTATFLKTFPSVYKGTHITKPFVRTMSGVRIDLDAPGQVAYADGERVGDLPVHIESRPNALRVLAPPVGP